MMKEGDEVKIPGRVRFFRLPPKAWSSIPYFFWRCFELWFCRNSIRHSYLPLTVIMVLDQCPPKKVM